jgi:hypothetical protein
MLTQHCAFLHTTEYPTAPLCILDPSVNMVSPGLSSTTSACLRLCPLLQHQRGLEMFRNLLQNGLLHLSRIVDHHFQSLSDAGFRLKDLSRLHTLGQATYPKAVPSVRRCLLSSWALAGRRPASADKAPMFVVRKQPITARVSWLTSFCSSSTPPAIPRPVPPFYHSSEPYIATD